MSELFARRALLPSGWADNVRIEIDAGVIVAVQAGADAYEDAVGTVIPGIPNAHSHAFQRALAGRAEHGSNRNSFWTWRHLMYALASRLDAQALEAIASQLYAEMLSAGYTSVVEFHYTHRGTDESEPGGQMYEALARAADRTGIRLIYAPVLYERADFDEPAPTPEQARFVMSCESYLAHVEWVLARVESPNSIALAVHSLRAVTPASLTAVADRAKSLECPLHIHVAEQQREVDHCEKTYGARPVQWLLDNHEVDERWTMVHATHIDAGECKALAESGAVAALCPSTEANLGDGLFPLEAYLRCGGSVAIGSDSHVTVDPFEELRWLEYGQRLITHRRNVAALASGHTGRDLMSAVQTGGTDAAGLPRHGIESGGVADLLVLDEEHPVLLAHEPETLLDALVFSAHGRPIDRVMVHGEWRTEGGRHHDAEAIREGYAAVMRSIDLGGERVS
jgi:formimidoylglutamate deiminase